ncbi:hypothetical protein QM012_009161 [Aureobasidium pullulans]|uniref:Fungal STAND N-terminal Goodbye domain-containing protein n=1 Tax=Aureobasidium pullulans TaxID=5580 RepID=A0ABR0TG44_AURPU
MKDDSDAYKRMSESFITGTIKHLLKIRYMVDPFSALSAAHQTLIEKGIDKGASIAYEVVKADKAAEMLVKELGKAVLLITLSAAAGTISLPDIGAGLFAIVMYFQRKEREDLQKIRAEIAASMSQKLQAIRAAVTKRLEDRKDFEQDKTNSNDRKPEEQSDNLVATVRIRSNRLPVTVKVTRDNSVAVTEVLDKRCNNIPFALRRQLSQQDYADTYASSASIIDAAHSSNQPIEAEEEAEILTYVQLLVDASAPAQEEIPEEAGAGVVPVFRSKTWAQ